MIAPPSSEDQLAFLTRLQRLFSEGDFTATYKFALLIALADLAVQQGRDDGDELRLTTRQVASEFISLYWQQSTPYRADRSATKAGVLVQNTGAQAAVVSAIAAFRERHAVNSVQRARALSAWRSLVSTVVTTVSAQPVKYLQNMGGRTEPFLYARESGAIVLKPGVAYCLRRFQPLVQQLARSHWIAHIKGNRRNDPFLGEAGDLEQFLFESSRRTLRLVGEGLLRLMGPHCFYCGGTIDEADVDHFVPFSLYPRDLTHNFVLTHSTCNRSKSDALAAKDHLERWVEYLDRHGESLIEIGSAAGMMSDLVASRAVASWAYQSALSAGSSAWVQARTFERIDSSYIDCLSGVLRSTRNAGE